ncbi:Maf family protein [Thalassotalea sp. Y01]|uniref:Maf family protein n=1 Tax=Thalassotalea sp. Y01 TaxID=2729613 RepID=UPI00145CE68D|nr:Maf family protein [Thalassotalea sp. Y01]NMP15710.1 septum formation inhibitor Maf [Thalassotalea sp. Y01]
MSLYLASKSPRRKELLAQLQPSFSLVEAEIDEAVIPDETAEQYVCRMAREKAARGWGNIKDADRHCWSLGSDTIVVFEQHILGKPKDFADCQKTLSMLSTNTHQVMTAVCLFNGEQELIDCVITKVQFRKISEQEITAYWQSNEPQDKAGSYGIQGIGGKFVKRIEGSYSAVVGLPLCETQELLNEAQRATGG